MVNSFLKNAEDSIVHALDHLIEDNKLSSFHNRKWFLFSAYHAAQMIFLHLIEKKEPGYCKKENYPTLNKKLLDKVKSYYTEEPYLKELFNLLSVNLKLDRDRIWHRDSIISVESIHKEIFSLMGIMQYCALQEQNEVNDLFKIEIDDLQLMVDSLSDQEGKLFTQYRKEQKNTDDAFKYENFVTDLLKHKYPNQYLHVCTWCGADAVLDDGQYCKACFREIDWFECDDCGESDYKVDGNTYHKC